MSPLSSGVVSGPGALSLRYSAAQSAGELMSGGSPLFLKGQPDTLLSTLHP